jgi:Domain of unknown function (DUF4392)
MKSILNRLSAIESRLQLDEGGRGITELILDKPQLYNACTEILNCKTIGILTGFPCIMDNPIRIESDGLAGSLCISRTLHKLGIESTILMDPDSIPYMEPLVLWHNNEFECKTKLSSSLELEFEGIISIERPGRSKDGNYYTMRAIKMDNVTEFDTRYLDSKPCKVRVAIGDGGNEAGLGPIQEKVRRSIKNGEIIASCSMSDYIIISSVSTWGGYGLSLGLSLLSNSEPCLSTDTEIRVAQVIMDAQICDGIIKTPHLGIDGLDWSFTYRFIQDILISIQN